MSRELYYRKADNSTIKLTTEKQNGIYNIYTTKLLTHTQTPKKLYSYLDLNSIDENTLKLSKSGERECYKFNKRDFYNSIEFKIPDKNYSCLIDNNPIFVNKIEDFINAIQIYSHISFLIRIKDIAELAKKTTIPTELCQCFEKVITICEGKIAEALKINTLDTGFIDKDKFELKNLSQGLCVNLGDAPILVCEVVQEIKNTIIAYNNGKNFAYYRGVGHIFYPEIPSVFRENIKQHEDQFYRQGKISHPEEFIQLKYLDRIAKLQHYSFPTRLLDVTSSPLVALYMSCNKTYTNDRRQYDFGEVIVYFRNELKEKSYDSNAVLISAALVKLTYNERQVMKNFITIHDRLIEKASVSSYKNNVIREFLNISVHAASEHSIDYYLNENDIAFAQNNKLNTIFADKSIFENLYGLYCELSKKNNVGNYNCPRKSYYVMLSEFIVAYNRLLVTARRENPAFQNKIDIFKMLKSYHVQIGMTNDRILAQSGSFIISGLDSDYINKNMKSSRSHGFKRIIVSDKKRVYKQLQALNINDSTMFPDLSHQSGYLKDTYQD